MTEPNRAGIGIRTVIRSNIGTGTIFKFSGSATLPIILNSYFNLFNGSVVPVRKYMYRAVDIRLYQYWYLVRAK
jgi:DNA/RNA endonuclease YhcR with UshA esterase domain